MLCHTSSAVNTHTGSWPTKTYSRKSAESCSEEPDLPLLDQGQPQKHLAGGHRSSPKKVTTACRHSWAQLTNNVASANR